MAKVETLFLRLNQEQQINTIIKIIDLSNLVFHFYTYEAGKAPANLLLAAKAYHKDPTDVNRELFNLAHNAFEELSESITVEAVDRLPLQNSIAAIQHATRFLYNHTDPELMSAATQSIDLACKSDSAIKKIIIYFMGVQTGKNKAHKHCFMD